MSPARSTAHPRDEWINITAFGETTPHFILAVDGREAEVAEARDMYVVGRIDIDEFQRRIDEAYAA